jgi:hypothetical protein
MKCSELVLKGTRILKEKGIEASRLEAEVLLAFAWRWDRTHLLIFFDEPVPGDVEKRYDDLICRRSRGVPVPYLTGEKEFMSLGFTVNPDHIRVIDLVHLHQLPHTDLITACQTPQGLTAGYLMSPAPCLRR